MAKPSSRSKAGSGRRSQSWDHGLSPVEQTLLIPLVARALGGELFPDRVCDDACALQVLERLGEDGRRYLTDPATVLNVLWRTGLIRHMAEQFFAQHPSAWGLNLGCGLTHYFQWLDNGENTWIDADLPDVMALRKRLLPAQPPRLRARTVDLQSPGWWGRMRLPKRALEQPVLVLCEGVLMYFDPEQVNAVLHEFAERAPAGSLLITDTVAGFVVGRAQWHASVGQTEAQIHWGVDNLHSLSDVHPRLRLLDSHSVAPSHGWMGMAMEAFWRPWGGAPLYGLVLLGV